MAIGRPLQSLIGVRFGLLLVVAQDPVRSKKGQVLWLCECDCGATTRSRSDSLKSGGATSCGCARIEQAATRARTMGEAHKRDLTGRRFGRLLVVEEADRPNGGAVQWLARCDCGNERVVLAGNITTGKTRSCGCLERESRIKHGLAHTRGYKAAICAKRRTRKSLAGGSYTEAQIRALYEVQKGACRYCNRALAYRDIHRDHRLPVALGGSSDISNMQILCRSCNLSKGALHPDKFEATLNNRQWRKD